MTENIKVKKLTLKKGERLALIVTLKYQVISALQLIGIKLNRKWLIIQLKVILKNSKTFTN